MANDPTQDQDFLNASPHDQHAYLMATDPDYAKAAPHEQVAYLSQVSPKLSKTQFEKDREGLTPEKQEAGYRDAYAKEQDRGGIVLSDMDTAMLGLGGMGAGRAIAKQGIKAAAKPIIKGTLGAVGGSAAGSYGGRELGRIVGHPEAGAQVGATVGGLAGGFFGGMSSEPLSEKGAYVPASQSPGLYRGPASVPKPIAPEPELGSPENPGLHSKMPTRMPKAAKVPAPSPFGEGIVSTAGPLPDSPLPSITANTPPPTQMPLVQSSRNSIAPEPVSIFPEPRNPLPTDRPGAMWTIKRDELPAAAAGGVPGAGDVLRNLNRPIVYTPREGVGYPGPRPTSITEQPSTSVQQEVAPRSITEPERRVNGGQPPAGTAERRSFYDRHKDNVGPTDGEQLEKTMREARTEKPSGVTEGEALQRIMKNPAEYEKYKAADQKTRDRMLVAASRR